MKTCSRCGVTKPLDEFTRRQSSVDGHNGVCKECKNAAQLTRDRQRRREARLDAAAANSEKALLPNYEPYITERYECQFCDMLQWCAAAVQRGWPVRCEKMDYADIRRIVREYECA